MLVRAAAHSVDCRAAVWAIVINNFTFHYAFYLVMNWLIALQGIFPSRN